MTSLNRLFLKNDRNSLARCSLTLASHFHHATVRIDFNSWCKTLFESLPTGKSLSLLFKRPCDGFLRQIGLDFRFS